MGKTRTVLEKGNKMEDLKPFAFYRSGDGQIYLSIGGNHVVSLHDPWTSIQMDELQWVADPGSPLGTRHMAAHVSEMMRQYTRKSTKVDHLQSRYEELGEALLAEADNRGWCSEYNEFASQWDLPLMEQTYEVEITINVSATTWEEAEDQVSENISFGDLGEVNEVISARRP